MDIQLDNQLLTVSLSLLEPTWLALAEPSNAFPPLGLGQAPVDAEPPSLIQGQ